MSINQLLLKLPYNICFCIAGKKILMLKRSRLPNIDLLNGIGGKLEVNEDPWGSIFREIKEEAGIKKQDIEKIAFKGIVTWVFREEKSIKYEGMYGFIANLDAKMIFPPRKTDEGLLEWKDLDWVLNPRNKEVIPNITKFLPQMLRDKQPKEYRLFYTDGELKKMTIHPLPTYIKLQTK
jgi:8-oxo-dGTP diphosphatase